MSSSGVVAGTSFVSRTVRRPIALAAVSPSSESLPPLAGATAATLTSTAAGCASPRASVLGPTEAGRTRSLSSASSIGPCRVLGFRRVAIPSAPSTGSQAPHSEGLLTDPVVTPPLFASPPGGSAMGTSMRCTDAPSVATSGSFVGFCERSPSDRSVTATGHADRAPIGAVTCGPSADCQAPSVSAHAAGSAVSSVKVALEAVAAASADDPVSSTPRGVASVVLSAEGGATVSAAVSESCVASPSCAPHPVSVSPGTDGAGVGLLFPSSSSACSPSASPPAESRTGAAGSRRWLSLFGCCCRSWRGGRRCRASGR